VNNDRKKHNAKPLKLKDYQRRALLANAAKGFESDDENENHAQTNFQTPAEEERALREETKAAFMTAADKNGTDDEDSDDSEDLLVRRDAEDSDDDEDQYKKFLLENVGEKELEKILSLRPEPNPNGIAPIADQQTEDDFLRK
jgi:protein KRI1